MAEPARISVADAREMVVAGKALLVCAYESPEKYKANMLEGSISLQELARLAPAKDQSIIFY